MMGEFLVYMIKSSICLALLYLFFKMMLSKETFHRFNRFALLGILAASFIIPSLKIHHPILETSSVSFTDFTQPVVSMVPQIAESQTQEIPWSSVLLLVYATGIVCFWTVHLYGLYNMYQLIRKGEKRAYKNGIKLSIQKESIAPFSWMNWVVIEEKDMKENGEIILKHETAHILNRHSWDLIAADLCISVQWFNPAAWLVKSELKNIHEFQADEWVLNQGIDAKKYQLLLIRKAVGTRLYSMANSFNHSTLKRRITMMIKKKSNPWARAKYLFVLPLAAIAVAAFARPEISSELNEISQAKVSDLSQTLKVKSPLSASDQEERTVRGKVVDAKYNQPLPGVSIIVGGTTNGTLSGKDGRFTLKVTEGSDLFFSYIGMKMQKLPLKDAIGKEITIRMQEEVTNLEGVVVTHMEKHTKQPIQSGDEIFVVVEQMPEFPGGMQALKKFLGQNVTYPEDAYKQKIEGRVIVEFTVKKDGSLSDFKVIRGVHPSLDSEALRVLKLQPRWKPGMQRNQAVNVKFTVPVTFSLQASDNESNKNCLCIMDGKVLSDKEVKAVDKTKVKNITVLKDQAAEDYIHQASGDLKTQMEQYINTLPEKKVDGVLLITLNK